jgi:aspartate kinase
MFRALADAGINVQLINTSEMRICAVVAGERGQAALACLNREFGR